MSTDIYYFSATGNSLTTARLLEKELGDECRCIPITALHCLDKVTVTAEAVGFVFPVYYSDMPWIVRDTVRHMDFQGQPYIFSLCTYRGHMGAVGERLDSLLEDRGVRLSLSMGIPMPGNSRISTPQEAEDMISAQADRVKQAAQRIRAREIENCSAAAPLEATLVDRPGNIRGLKADESCTGCGLCAKLCPMDNISIQEGKAVLGDNCITCLTCFHWCPVEAVYMSLDENISRRFKYRHPDATWEDIASQKRGR